MITVGMDNKNFYPTPEGLIDKMLSNVDWNTVKTILEPSAGKGNIVERIMNKQNYFYGRKMDIDCIEIDEQLQNVLRGKGYKVVYNNFLTFDTMKHYDLIVMNPPFDNGVKHALKAIEMQKNGGGIICLLNAETLKNPYSNERKELLNKLSEANASIEYIDYAFLSAERTTDVSVAIIKVWYSEKENILDDETFNKFKKSNKYKFEETTSEQEKMLTRYTLENDFIPLLVEQFEAETRAGLYLIDEYLKLKPCFADTVNSENSSYYSYTLALYLQGEEDQKYSSRYCVDKNEFLKVMRKKYWNFLFGHKKFIAKLTSNLQEELHKRIDKYAEYDFSVFNIYTLMQELQVKTIQGIEETLLSLFDELSGKYAYHEELNNKNIHYFNGWKSNKAWYINNKVVMPYLRSGYRGFERLYDIHKTLAYIAGHSGDFDVYAKLNKLEKESTEYYPGSYFDRYIGFVSLPYFDVKFFKKGTAHIIFKDKDLLDRFNLWACKQKNWIPHFYGKKAYKDMSHEEKELVKEFSGSEENYNNIYNNQSKYIIDTQNVLMIGGVIK